MLKPNEIWDKEDRPDASRSLARSDASEASVPDNSNSVDEEVPPTLNFIAATS